MDAKPKQGEDQLGKKTSIILIATTLVTVLTASVSYYLFNQPKQTQNYPSPKSTPTPTPTPSPTSTSTPAPSAIPTSEPLATPEPSASASPFVPEPSPTPTPSTDAILVDYWETERRISDQTMTVWIKYTLRLRGYSSVNINIAEICLNGTYYPTSESSYYYTLISDENFTSNALSYELPLNSTYAPMYYSEFLNFEFTAHA